MKIKVKLKGLDDLADENGLDTKKGIIDAIKVAEQRFPNIELVHIKNNPKNHLRLYDLEQGNYVLPQDNREFLKVLNQELNNFAYNAYIIKKDIMIGALNNGVRDILVKENTPQVERNEQNFERNFEPTNEGDSRYTYGTITAGKLEEFLERYSSYLRDETAELQWNRSKSKWGPRFGYKQDGDFAPDEAKRDEIREYVNQTFYE